MKIIKSKVQEDREQNYKKEDFIENILDQIFMISKSDESFKMTQNIDQSNKTIKMLEKKINNKISLLKKSDQLKKEFEDKISNIKNQNLTIKINLLELLGAEI